MSKTLLDWSSSPEERMANTVLVNDRIARCKGKDSPCANSSIDICVLDRKTKLIRLTDRQFVELRRNAVSIEEDDLHALGPMQRDNVILGSLSRMYVTLTTLFGEHGNHYDDYTSSFSFPFLIHFPEEEDNLGYLIEVKDVKGSILFPVYKILHPDEEIDRVCVSEPFADFRKHEISFLIGYIIGYSTGIFEAISKVYEGDFLKSIRSQRIVYGYQDGDFLDMQCDTVEAFWATLDKYRS